MIPQTDQESRRKATRADATTTACKRSVALTETEQKPIICPRWVPIAISESTLAQVPGGMRMPRRGHVLVPALRVVNTVELASERAS